MYISSFMPSNSMYASVLFLFALSPLNKLLYRVTLCYMEQHDTSPHRHIQYLARDY